MQRISSVIINIRITGICDRNLHSTIGLAPLGIEPYMMLNTSLTWRILSARGVGYTVIYLSEVFFHHT